jgi:hypothetical protein
MPLKHIDNANPDIKRYWFEILDYGHTSVGFASKKAATNIRSQLSQWRTLASRQAPEFFKDISGITLEVMLFAQDHWVIVGRKPIPLPQTTGSLRFQNPQDGEVYRPEQHHHNPIGLTPTGIPQQMPEVILPGQTQDELEKEARRREAEEHNQDFLRMLKRNGLLPDSMLGEIRGEAPTPNEASKDPLS